MVQLSFGLTKRHFWYVVLSRKFNLRVSGQFRPLNTTLRWILQLPRSNWNLANQKLMMIRLHSDTRCDLAGEPQWPTRPSERATSLRSSVTTRLIRDTARDTTASTV